MQAASYSIPNDSSPLLAIPDEEDAPTCRPLGKDTLSLIAALAALSSSSYSFQHSCH
jgi:hypothetical protein